MKLGLIGALFVLAGGFGLLLALQNNPTPSKVDDGNSEHSSGTDKSEQTTKKASSTDDELTEAEEDGLKVLDWKLLNQFDYKTGKGPEELMKLDGEIVRIPGFVVPLSDDYSKLDEFLIVPDGQACIHVPPPPPNLILAAKMRKQISAHDVPNPAWITGRFTIEESKSDFGGAAYKMDVMRLKEYVYAPPE